jgi:hypothetical protein
MELALFALFAVVVGGGSFLLMRRRERLRREAMAAWAGENGWSVEAGGAPGELAAFQLGRQRGQRTLSVLRRRRDGLDVTVFDHVYVTGSGKSRTAHHQTVCVVGGEAARVPTFFLRRQVPFFDALGKLFGGQDVNFDDDPEFSRRYVLQSQAGEAPVRQAFTPSVRAHFVERASDRLVAEGAGGRLLVHRGVFLPPEQLSDFVDEAVAIHRLWR